MVWASALLRYSKERLVYLSQPAQLVYHMKRYRYSVWLTVPLFLQVYVFACTYTMFVCVCLHHSPIQSFIYSINTDTVSRQKGHEISQRHIFIIWSPLRKWLFSAVVYRQKLYTDKSLRLGPGKEHLDNRWLSALNLIIGSNGK